ncbi:hypothetical protein QUR79_10915 [Arcobacter cryaerophilus gv. pseudocryaerophilus]|jgi:hypothetical protein|uniref:Uncharacterized protein n=2 Tax=Arcobacteraceae TaxID=2808963 RepID=A0AAU0P2J6_9BACT|nr:hypothetical protein RJG54_07860 [Arcobacter sp. AZ-2023]WPD03252.1 hypothetical protein QUR79_10915 [Arcobacter sp. DSM 115972]
MNFISNTQEELKLLNIIDGNEYLIEYKNKDYFNGEETIEKTKAKALINDNQILFIVPDPYGMDRFISDVKIL